MGRPKRKRNIKGPQRIKKKLKRVKKKKPAATSCKTCEHPHCTHCEVTLDSV